jgi:hypothetical protein
MQQQRAQLNYQQQQGNNKSESGKLEWMRVLRALELEMGENKCCNNLMYNCWVQTWVHLVGPTLLSQRYKWWPPQACSSQVYLNCPFFYIKSYALLIDPLRDREMYLARWVKFTVEKQRLSKLYDKICLNKNTSHDATNVLWRIFLPKHTKFK